MIGIRKRWGQMISMLLVAVMVFPLIPIVPVAASEMPSTNDQVVIDQSSGEKPEQTNTPEAPTGVQTQPLVNSISGSLWLDTYENIKDGIYSGDGIRQPAEQVLSNYDVSLYKEDDKITAVQTVVTDGNGEYRFENIKAGSYIVGISQAEVAGVEYLLPISGITADNKFEDFNNAFDTIYSKVIQMEESTIVANVNAGMRTPPRIQLRASSYAVTRNDTSAPIGTYTTIADAVNACLVSIPCTITAMGDDLNMGSVVTIPNNKDIVLQSNGSANYIMTQVGGTRHFRVDGTLTIQNITLSGIGSSSSDNGGIEVTGNLWLESGAMITGCYKEYGGGVNVATGGTFTMDGGAITSNEADYGGGVDNNGTFTMEGGELAGNHAIYGGGVNNNGTFTLDGGELIGNKATIGGGANNNGTFTLERGVLTGNEAPYGGGVKVASGGAFTMKGGEIGGSEASYGGGVDNDGTFILEGGEITGNEVANGGGGVNVNSGGTFTLEGGEITGNAATDGGGVGVYSGGTFAMEGGEITGNTAIGDGGGIFVSGVTYSDPALASEYSDITIFNTAIVSGNTATQSFTPPTNATDFTTRATNPFDGTLLDNNNINYRNPNVFVKYNANNSTSAIYNDPMSYTAGNTVTVSSLTTTGITAATGYTFQYWCTKMDDTGTRYYPGGTFSMPGNDLTLYAIWKKDTYTINVRYVDRNNIVVAPPSTEMASYGDPFTATAISVSGKMYVGWYMGTGTPALSTIKATTVVPHIAVAGPVDHNTTITLVYDQYTGGGSGGGGTGGPVVKTYTVTEKHMSGTNVLATYSRTINEGATYNGVVDTSLPKGYTYTGYNIDTTMKGMAPSLPTLNNVVANHTVILEYASNLCEVNVTYEYHSNDGKVTALSGSQRESVALGSTFTATIPKFKQKVQTGWTLNGKVQSGKPMVKNVTAATTMVLIYQQDMDEDNVHDYTITQRYLCNVTGKLLYTCVIYKAEYKDYDVVIKNILHHKFIGYRIDGGKLQKASADSLTIQGTNATIPRVSADHTIELMYDHEQYTITVNVVDDNGNTISGKGYTVKREYQQSFHALAPSVKGHTFVKWKLNGVNQKGSTVSIQSVQKDATVTAIYQKNGLVKTNKRFFIQPKTGDSSSLALTYVMMGVSLGGMFVLTGSRKRKKHTMK